MFHCKKVAVNLAITKSSIITVCFYLHKRVNEWVYEVGLTDAELRAAGLLCSSSNRAAVHAGISFLDRWDAQREFPFAEIPAAAKRHSASELCCLIIIRKTSTPVNQDAGGLVELPFKQLPRHIAPSLQAAVQSHVLSDFNPALLAG